MPSLALRPTCSYHNPRSCTCSLRIGEKRDESLGRKNVRVNSQHPLVGITSLANRKNDMNNYIHSGCSSLRGQKCLLRNLKFGPHSLSYLSKNNEIPFFVTISISHRLFFSVYILDSRFSTGNFQLEKNTGKDFSRKSHPRDLRVPVLRDVVAPRRCSENSVLAQSLVENLPQSVFSGFFRRFFLKTNTC